MHALTIPPAALRDEKSIHLLGAWIAEEGLHCSLNVSFFEGNGHNEPNAWGIVLADVIRHLAGALNKHSGADQQASIELITQAMHAELEEPTSEAKGDFVAKPN